MAVVGVKFDDNCKEYYFECGELNLKLNLTVIVETERGLQFGKVSSFINEDKLDKNVNYKKVIRISSKKDYLQHLTNIKDAENAIVKCRELINKYGLNMIIMDASYTFDRSQLLFRFLSDERVDFRQLAKDLSYLYKTRIELRQIGIRDKAKDIGGLGPCGRKLCCSSFLSDFNSVSINMAKNQSLALNPAKINGVCGRLLCCLKYENDDYKEYKKDMPSVGKKIITDTVEGKVISVDLFNKSYKVLDNSGNIVEVNL